jgi:hypothetical protein
MFAGHDVPIQWRRPNFQLDEFQYSLLVPSVATFREALNRDIYVP